MTRRRSVPARNCRREIARERTACHRSRRARENRPINKGFFREPLWPADCSVQWLVKIQLTFAESTDPLEELLGGRLTLTEVIEGRQEFLEELVSRLHAITLPEPATPEIDAIDADATLPLRWNRRSTDVRVAASASREDEGRAS
jgi:hypothetical protein